MAGYRGRGDSMEEEYWRRFLKTGEIRDYLYYKGMAILRQVMDRYTCGDSHSSMSCESGEGNESDYSDRHGACGGTCR